MGHNFVLTISNEEIFTKNGLFF